jgi:hypothetical protein
MAKPGRTQIFASSENLYATREDFRKILDEDLDRLYQLLFYLPGIGRARKTASWPVLRPVLIRSGCSANGFVPGRSAFWWKTQFVN